MVYEFLNTSNSYEQPKPQHYRSADFKHMEMAKISAWGRIVDCDIPLPTSTIKLYDSNGTFTSSKSYPQYTDGATHLATVINPIPHEHFGTHDTSNMDGNTLNSVG